MRVATAAPNVLLPFSQLAVCVMMSPVCCRPASALALVRCLVRVGRSASPPLSFATRSAAQTDAESSRRPRPLHCRCSCPPHCHASRHCGRRPRHHTTHRAQHHSRDQQRKEGRSRRGRGREEEDDLRLRPVTEKGRTITLKPAGETALRACVISSWQPRTLFVPSPDVLLR